MSKNVGTSNISPLKERFIMDNTIRNQKKDDDENEYGMRKITYLEKYGIKHFPYRGKRKYAPSIYRSVDGRMVISNDIFGLTIRQFERMYKDCLHRRKTHEQWILNLRYPDKSSNEYLEYLQNCTDFNKDHSPWSENELKEKYLFELLVKTVGTEIDIRIRQRLFIVQDTITNSTNSNTQISSGSLAEGLDLPGSDIDIMSVCNDVVVKRNVRDTKYIKQYKQPKQRAIFVMETDNDYPGFTKLRLIAAGDTVDATHESIEMTTQGLYLSVNGFLKGMKEQFQHVHLIPHGPCLTLSDQARDMAFCFRCTYLPYNAASWPMRYRRQWPSNFVIDKIEQYGCLIVPIGPKNKSDSNILWRLSFSMAEKQLVHSFNFTQLLCYGLLKLTLKRIINTNDDLKDLLCSYFLKTALFWVSEEVDIDTFQLPKLFRCFFLCLDKLISWVEKCYCPNYFIPEHNMFLEKITPDNNTMLLCVLNTLLVDGVDRLISGLFPPTNRHNSLKSECSFIKLDLLFYRISGERVVRHITECYNVQTLTESLRKSEMSTFICEVCKYEYNRISKFVVQLLPPPTVINKEFNILNMYHRHLQDYIKTDAVSGWLFYASFYYVTGQYNVTLKLIEYVLSRCSPDMVNMEYTYCEERINSYTQNVHSKMTFLERIKIAVVDSVFYAKHSSLIPGELQLEVKYSAIGILPITMCHCLRFLCFNHLGEIINRQQALRALHLRVREDYHNEYCRASDALTILGVCMDLSGDKNSAYICFHEALQCDYIICPSAKIRVSQLFDV